MEKEYTIINGELYHGGPGSGRWKAGSTGNTAGSRRMLLLEQRKKNKYRNDNGDEVEIMPEGWKKPSGSSTSSGGTSSSSTSSFKTKNDPGETKPKEAGTASNDSGKNKQQTTANTSSNKQSNSNSNQQTNKTDSNKPDSNKALNDEINKLKKDSSAAKNIGQEIQNMARTTEGLKVDRPRMDLSDKSIIQLRTEIARERAEREYNELFSQPTKKEKAKAKMAKFLNTTGTALAYTGSALAIAAYIKELQKK